MATEARLVTPRGVARALTVPACVVCAGSPLLLGPLAGLGASVIVAGEFVHSWLIPLAPLNFFFLYRGYRVHHRRLALILGGVGTLLILLHLTGHFGAFDWLVGKSVITSTNPRLLFPKRWVIGMIPIWLGSPLLAAGNYLDIRARWEARNTVLGCGSAEEYWRAVLDGTHAGLREGRAVLSRLPSAPRCKFCAAPFGGVGKFLMRLIGRTPSSLNPSFCTSCLKKTPAGGAELDLAVLFADVRGSTKLGEQVGASEFAGVMERFYATAAQAVVQHGGLLRGFIGDAVLAFFSPGFAGEHYPAEAIEAARELVATASRDGLAVGAGVHRGSCFAGLTASEIGRLDLDAKGDTVNVAARLASAASAGHVLVSEAAGGASPVAKEQYLKGRQEPVRVVDLNDVDSPPDRGVSSSSRDGTA